MSSSTTTSAVDDMSEMLPSERKAYLSSYTTNTTTTTKHLYNPVNLPPPTFFNAPPLNFTHHVPRQDSYTAPTNYYDVDFFSTNTSTLPPIAPPLSPTPISTVSATDIVTLNNHQLATQPSLADKYIIEGVIGRGAFSTIHLGINRTTRTRVAIKLMDYTGNPTLAHRMATIEASVYRLVNNQCLTIVQCFDFLQTNDGLVLEYCPAGDLFDLLAYRHADLSMREAARIAFQLCSAVAFIHDLNIVHRDLKLDNILMVTRTPPFSIKLSDFGLAKILTGPDELISTRAGSEEYLAPEVIILTEKPFAPKPADMWSVGVILYALVVGQLPFEQEDRDVVVEEQVPVMVQDMDAIEPGSNRAFALLKHLETTFAFTDKLQPEQAMVVLNTTNTTTQSPPRSPTRPLSSTSPTSRPSSVCATPVKVERRRSTRRAGRKALWHRIARAEYTFPDELVHNNLVFPLLTSETKAIVRLLINVSPCHRLTARECCEDVPWIRLGNE